MNETEVLANSIDAQLVQRCLQGERRGVSAFIHKFQSMIYNLCYRMLNHQQDAEDATQESLLRAFNNLHQWDSTRPLKPWLLTIAANRCRTALQKRVRYPKSIDFVEESALDQTKSDSRDLAEELQLGLNLLREEYKTCFILFYQQELNCHEIAEMMECPVGTVKTWLHRARREIAEFLKRRGLVEYVH